MEFNRSAFRGRIMDWLSGSTKREKEMDIFNEEALSKVGTSENRSMGDPRTPDEMASKSLNDPNLDQNPIAKPQLDIAGARVSAENVKAGFTKRGKKSKKK